MTITRRIIKGSSLTYEEMDENIRDLRFDTTLDRVTDNGNVTNNNITVNDIVAANIVANNITVISENPSLTVAAISSGIVRTVFVEYSSNVSQNTTIGSGKQATAGGPITIDTGIELTIEDGGTLTIT
jgi:hypothetical protein